MKTMKTMNYFTAFVFMLTLSLPAVFAQTPQKMNYQAVVRNANDELLINQSVSAEITIHQADLTSRSMVYIETHKANTNNNGLLTLEIGSGVAVSGSFSSIDWANSQYVIEVAIDVEGGTDYTLVNEQQLMSVPYALYAQRAKSVDSMNYCNITNAPTIPTKLSDLDNDINYLDKEVQVLRISNDTLFLTGGSFVVLPQGFDGNYNSLTNQPNIPSVVNSTLLNAFQNPTIKTYLMSQMMTDSLVGVIAQAGMDTAFSNTNVFVDTIIQKLIKDTILAQQYSETIFDSVLIANPSILNTSLNKMLNNPMMMTFTGSMIDTFLVRKPNLLMQLAQNVNGSQLLNFVTEIGFIDSIYDGMNTVITEKSAEIQEQISDTINAVKAHITTLLDSATAEIQEQINDTINAVKTQITVLLYSAIVASNTPHSVTNNSIAISSGYSLTQGSTATVLSAGVCYSQLPNPTVDDCMNFTSDTIATGAFISNITGLSANTTYYIRPYVITSIGRVYGDQKVVTTLF